MNKMISPLSEAQIKKYKKLQDKAEENTQNTGYFIDEFDYYYGNLAEDLIYDAKDKEWAREIYKIVEDKIGGEIDGSFYISFACAVASSLGDKEWAKKLFKEQLESSKGFSRPTSDTFVNIAAFAYMDLNDRKLAKEIFIQAIDESKNNPDEIDYIIESVEDEWGYNDKGLAQKLKKKYKK